MPKYDKKQMLAFYCLTVGSILSQIDKLNFIRGCGLILMLIALILGVMTLAEEYKAYKEKKKS